MISVIIPLYNKERTIKKTLYTVLDQSYNNIEIIIVDDGSTDCSADVISSLKDDRIKYYYKENGGVSSARNYGINKASGDYIFFLDADDIIYPVCLELLLDGFKQYPDSDVIVANYLYVNNKKKEIASNIESGYIEHPLKLFYLSKLSLRTGTMLFKYDVFQQEKFDTRISVHEDTKMWIEIMKNFKLSYISSIVHEYRMEESYLSIKKIDIKKEYAYYLDLSKTNNAKYERYIKGNNYVCSIINRVFKGDWETVWMMLFKNFRYIPFLFQMYIYRKLKL